MCKIPPRSAVAPETPNNYVAGMTTCKSRWRCDNVGGLGLHVTCHILVYFFSVLGIPQSLNPWTKFNDLYVT